MYYDKVQRKVIMTSETEKILADKELMEKIRKARKSKSKSSPYKRLEE